MAQRYKTKSMRLWYWNYTTPWWYFVTICTKNRINYFGEIKNDKMVLNEIGKIAKHEWIKTAELRENVELDEFIIMPNHFHAIIIINENKNDCRDVASNVSKNKIEIETNPNTEEDVARYVSTFNEKYYSDISPNPKSLSSIIRGFKSAVTKECNSQKINFKWQPKFYDRIIRNQRELDNIQRYIQQNPLKWELEKGMPENSDL